MPQKKPPECVAFGLAVRRARQRLSLSQDDFAAIARLHRTYIGGVERGERNPTLSTICRIAKALRLSPEEILAMTGEILRVEGRE